MRRMPPQPGRAAPLQRPRGDQRHMQPPAGWRRPGSRCVQRTGLQRIETGLRDELKALKDALQFDMIGNKPQAMSALQSALASHNSGCESGYRAMQTITYTSISHHPHGFEALEPDSIIEQPHWGPQGELPRSRAPRRGSQRRPRRRPCSGHPHARLRLRTQSSAVAPFLKALIPAIW